MSEVRFFIPGYPAPGGSKSAFVPTNRQTGEPYRKNGRIIVNVTDAGGAKTKLWRQEVAKAALIAMKEADLAPWTCALEVEMIFHLPRPKSHFVGKSVIHIRPGSPMFPAVRPDCLKLARSTEDACTGIVWRDDGQIVKATHEKVYSDRPGAWVIVRNANSKPAVPPPTECPESGVRAI